MKLYIIFTLLSVAYAGNSLNLGPVEVEVNLGHVDPPKPQTKLDKLVSRMALAFFRNELKSSRLNPFHFDELKIFQISSFLTLQAAEIVVEGAKAIEIAANSLKVLAALPINVHGEASVPTLQLDFIVQLITPFGTYKVATVHAVVDNLHVKNAALQEESGVQYVANIDNLQVQSEFGIFSILENNTELQRFLLELLKQRIANAIGEAYLERLKSLYGLVLGNDNDEIVSIERR